MTKANTRLEKHSHNYLLNDTAISKNQRKTLVVVVLTTVMMVVEIAAGYVTGSMALLADGWHMASHAGALSISLVAYFLAKSHKMNDKFSFGAGKFIPLGGYTSAVLLALIAVLMGFESISRLINPLDIEFRDAIIVAVVGLVVNVVSAIILAGQHSHSHGHEHNNGHKHVHDHNLRSAYIHVIADALTSVLAIVALTVGMVFGIAWLDSIMGIVGALVILKWAYNLCRDTAWELLDGHAKSIDRNEVLNSIETNEISVIDLHTWRIAPKAVACELVVFCNSSNGASFYKNILKEKFGFQHITVEERT